jgi:hypothetical protein
MRQGFVFVGVLALCAVEGHVEASAKDPPEVVSFIKRVANCRTPGRLDAAGRQLWACDKLLADKQHLIARYRKQPTIVEALNGRWIIQTERILNH